MVDHPAHSVLSQFGIAAVPTRKRCGPNETHAGGVIEAIFDRHGPDHLETVLTCITGAKNGGLWSETIGAVSDVLAFRGSWPIPAMKGAFASVDLQKHRNLAVRLRPWPVRGTLRVLIDHELERLIGVAL